MADIRFLPYPKFKVDKADGTPLVGGKVNVYAAGTSTRITTWADSEKSGANQNPVILNARGEADIWFDVPAKIVLTDSDDVQIWSEDNLSPLNAQTITGKFNLVENGSFELDGDGDDEPDDWTISLFNSGTSTVEIDTTNVVDGVNSIKFVSQGDGGGTATSTLFPVPDGGNIGVSFYLKSTVADVRNIVRVQYYDKNGASTSSTTLYDEASSNPTSFELKAFGTAVPAGSTQAEVVVVGCDSSDATSGTTYVDLVQVTTQSYVFTGTAGEVTADVSDLNKTSNITTVVEKTISLTNGATALHQEVIQAVFLGLNPIPYAFSAVEADGKIRIIHGSGNSSNFSGLNVYIMFGVGNDGTAMVDTDAYLVIEDFNNANWQDDYNIEIKVVEFDI